MTENAGRDIEQQRKFNNQEARKKILESDKDPGSQNTPGIEVESIPVAGKVTRPEATVNPAGETLTASINGGVNISPEGQSGSIAVENIDSKKNDGLIVNSSAT